MEAHAEEMSLKRDKFHLHSKRFPALASIASQFQSNAKNMNVAYFMAPS